MSEVPPGWAETTLGELVETVRGLTYKKEQASMTAAGGLVPLIRATNVQDGRLLLDEQLLFLPESLVRNEQWLQLGDIVIASSSGSSSVVGKSAPLRGEWHGTFGAFCTVLRPTSKADPRFLAHLVGSPTVRRRWSGLASGTNINNLKSSHLTETPVALPPLNEQRRIVAAIEEQFSRLDAAEQSLSCAEQRLRQLRPAILAEAVDGSWPVESLGDLILSLRNGVFVSRPAAEPPGTAIFRISAVRSMSLDADDVRYAPNPEADVSRFLVDEGDLLFTRYSGNPEYVGACARVRNLPRPTLYPDKLIRVVLNRELVDPAFVELACATGATLDAIRARRKTTAGQVGIAGGQLKSIPVPIPPLDEQRRIVAEVEQRLSVIEAMGDAIEVAKRRSATLRRSILERAFGGDLVTQDPADEPATTMLDRSRADRGVPRTTGRRRKPVRR